MKAPARSRPWRYQLSKRALAVLDSGHPWIFRGLLSSAAHALPDGQWLALHDGANRVVGHGVYAAEGAVAIRVLARGPERPGGATFAARIDAALARRAPLRAETDGFRAIHGESDGLPAVVVDVFGPVVVAQSYAAGVDALARFAGRRVARALGAQALILRAGHRRFSGGGEAPRVVAGEAADEVVFHEGPLALHARPRSGQKSGSFLDLRGLRRWVAGAPLAGARVLNLFAYTGGLGLAAEHAGAVHVTQVDRSADALALAARHHVRDPARHTFAIADAFGWRPPDREARFELVIVDPPSMTSRKEQVGQVLAAYRRLHHHAAGLVAPGGQLVLCCCTSRVTRRQFLAVVAERRDRFDVIADQPPELDHPVGFPEADYLKVVILRARS